MKTSDLHSMARLPRRAGALRPRTALLVLAWACLLLAPALGPAQQKKQEEEKDYIKVIHADSFSRSGKTKITTLKGNAIVAHNDTRFYADEIVIDDEKDTGRATGHLKITDPDSEIVGDLITADFTQELAVITGNVRMKHQKKPAEPEQPAGAEKPESPAPAPGTPANQKAPETTGSNKEKEPETVQEFESKLTVITCTRIDFYYEVDRAEAIGNVVAKQEKKTVYADRLVYDKKAEILTVDGQARVETEDGDLLHFRGVVVDLDQDTVEGALISGQLHREKKQSTEEKKPPAEQRLAPQPGEKPKQEAPKPAEGGGG